MARKAPRRADREVAMTIKTPSQPPVPDELDRRLRRRRAPIRPEAGDHHRDRPTLGTRRGSAGAALRGGRSAASRRPSGCAGERPDSRPARRFASDAGRSAISPKTSTCFAPGLTVPGGGVRLQQGARALWPVAEHQRHLDPELSVAAASRGPVYLNHNAGHGPRVTRPRGDPLSISRARARSSAARVCC